MFQGFQSIGEGLYSIMNSLFSSLNKSVPGERCLESFPKESDLEVKWSDIGDWKDLGDWNKVSDWNDQGHK